MDFSLVMKIYSHQYGLNAFLVTLQCQSNLSIHVLSKGARDLYKIHPGCMWFWVWAPQVKFT